MARNQVEKKKVIAVTGGIGSGKSTLISLLQKRGYTVVSSDQIVNGLYRKRSFLIKIKELFPRAVKGIFNLKVDKNVIAEQVFSNEEKRKALNSLIHPIVIREGIKKCKKTTKNLAFMEVPLLFEGGYQKEFDGVIIVLRDYAKRIESVKIRSNLSEDEIIRRIKAQVDYEKLDTNSYHVIKNDGEIADLEKELEKIINKL